MAERMQVKGFENVYALKGGWHEWQRADFPTEPK
jgi:3-mercaptopyruvate sulfurtransferase SseA